MADRECVSPCRSSPATRFLLAVAGLALLLFAGAPSASAFTTERTDTPVIETTYCQGVGQMTICVEACIMVWQAGSTNPDYSIGQGGFWVKVSGVGPENPGLFGTGFGGGTYQSGWGC